VQEVEKLFELCFYEGDSQKLVGKEETSENETSTEKVAMVVFYMSFDEKGVSNINIINLIQLIDSFNNGSFTVYLRVTVYSTTPSYQLLVTCRLQGARHPTKRRLREASSHKFKRDC